MTVPSSTAKSGPYLSNGVTDVFNYDFRIVDKAHLRVVLTDAAGEESDLTLTTHYTVSDVGSESGSINLTSSGLALAVDGTKITILRNPPFTQDTDLQNQGAYLAQTVEDRFDLAVMQIQTVKEKVDRAIVIQASDDSTTGEELSADVARLAGSADNIDTVAENVAAVNTTATNIAAVIDAPNQAAVAAASATAAATSATNAADSETAAQTWAEGTLPGGAGTKSAKEWAEQAASSALGIAPLSYTGDGATVDFTLPVDPGFATNVRLAVDGVAQKPGTAFTVSGTTLTFTEAPPDGSEIFGFIITATEIDIGVPSVGSVGSDELNAAEATAMRGVLDIYSTGEVDDLVAGVKGANIASAATIDLGAATGDFVDITGTTAITSLGTADAGVERTVRFTGILTLTHNAASLILYSGLNITTYNGLVLRFRSLGAGNWIETSQTPARGTWTPTLTFGGGAVGMTFHASTSGTFVKRGKEITVQGYLRLTAKGTSTGSAQMGGLPVGAPNTGGGALSVNVLSGMTGLTGMVFGGTNGAGATTISIRQWAATGANSISDANFTDTSWITFTLTYETV